MFYKVRGIVARAARMIRRFSREAKVESRVHCSCELCRLRFGRLFEPWRHAGRWRRFRSRVGYRQPLREDLVDLLRNVPPMTAPEVYAEWQRDALAPAE